ncbi:MAG TPA: DUF1592 domain-containing protein, partial [Polyangiaceae bacterium LLY-WYZ-15_(1-7)]|nr:DUF1592 domain-containing protein [Polyangiaceae bacterium LLY-WYZ-15_(1-7)]
SGPGGGGTPLTCDAPVVPPTVIRRLTRDQYDLTVRDLLGDATGPARAFPADDDAEGFQVGGIASALLVEQVAATAEVLAERAAMDLDALLPCSPTAAGCADAFIDDFGRRAYRRPLTDDEHARLRTVFDVGEAEEGFAGGAELVVRTVLQSPHFLYHVEEVPASASAGDVVPVEDYALASRLSYFLWGSMPDEALLDAAAAGRLRDRAGLLAEAERMLEDPRALEGFHSFTGQWLHVEKIDGVSKDPAVHPEFTDAVARDLQRSLELFLEEVFERGDARLLFDATFAYVNANVAPYFGLEASDFGDDFERVDVDPTQRAGIVTHPGLLAYLGKPNQSDPIHRAVFVFERLLCQNLPSPPDDIAIVAPDPEPGLTTRERFAEHSSNPACASCHALLDPIGFGFEHYDATGAWRDEENGRPVDATGEIVGTEDVNGPFDGAVDLAHRLSESDQATRCVARELFRFALQRVEVSDDACSLQSIDDGFAEADYDLRELMLAIVGSDAFRFQQVQP